MVLTNNEFQQRERIRTVIHDTAEVASQLLAAELATLIRRNTAAGRPTVLGLATGSTPVRLYRELIRLHREEGLSFRQVVTFNLDEYYGLPRTHPESYWSFMHGQLFDHLDIPASQINIPDGTMARGAVFDWCQRYEEKIQAAGGLDVQLLGIGRTGHIGFNEPGSGRESRTRLVTLDALTRRDAARDFLGESHVPRHAITMGVGTILGARRIELLAWGEAKARVIAEAVEHPPSETLPASLLQGHPTVTFHVDRAAAGELTRVRHPWLVGPVVWKPAVARRAVVWLSTKVKKPVLKLLDEDYSEHGMADLQTEQGPSYDLNIRIFNELQHSITGWPGGKAAADDKYRPERAEPQKKRVIIFSPEPSDDILGMGGTIRRLVDQGHDVTVAYQTSGNLGVPDEEAAMAAELVLAMGNTSEAMAATNSELAVTVQRQLREKRAFAVDSDEIRQLKGLLRRSEACAALRGCGITADRTHFLDLPFYQGGRYRQFKSGEIDVAVIKALLREVKPHQIFATGRQTDPSSVSGVCFEVLRQALTQCASDDWQRECRLWLYRGPDRHWGSAEIDMAVPLSPRELTQKIQAVYQHKSQRSQSPVVTAGQHETWQQAEQHNRAIAHEYDALGLAEYEAIEAFERGSL